MIENKRGRKQKFSEEKLKKIIDLYFLNNEVYGQVEASEIAKYAEEELNCEGIKYYHFTRKKEIKALLDETNHGYEMKDEKNKQELFRQFNADRFLELYGDNKRMMKVVLRRFQESYEELNYKVVEHQKLVLKYEGMILQLENEIKDLKEKQKSLKQDNREIISVSRKLKNFKSFTEKGAILEYLKEKGLIRNLDEENLKITLASCNLLNNDEEALINRLEEECYEDADMGNLTKEVAYNEGNDKTKIVKLQDIKENKNKEFVNDALSTLKSRLKKKD